MNSDSDFFSHGVLRVNGGVTPCRHLRLSSGGVHTVFIRVQSTDDD